MIRTAKIYGLTITLGEIKEFVTEAERIGATDDTAVKINKAPETGYQMDPGGEVSVSVTVTS